jgi:hypothetical protein
MLTHLFIYLPTHVPKSSTEDISFYQVIIYPRPSTFYLKTINRYLPNPTYMVALTFLVVFPTHVATTENYNEKNKMKILQ